MSCEPLPSIVICPKAGRRLRGIYVESLRYRALVASRHWQWGTPYPRILRGFRGFGMTLSRRTILANGLASGAALLAAPPVSAKPNLHQRLLCLDTHLDTPSSLARPGWDMMQSHNRAEDFTQVDYPRMVEGGLDGRFLGIYNPPRPLTPE